MNPRATGVAAARWLVEQHRHRRPFTGFPADIAPRDLAQAYRVQEAFVRLKARACGAPCGWKIALSNRAMQQFVGLDAPIAGRLLRRQVVAAPASTRASDYGRLLVEFEIAIELGADLGPGAAPHTRASVAAAVRSVGPAFELADDRNADYAQLAAHGLQLVADNAWNEGAVLGVPRRDWRALDLGSARGSVTIDDAPAGSGLGRDLMGHPLDALAWLARSVAARGQTMRAGDVAILGTLVTTRFPRAGQRLVFALEGFDPIVLQVT
jgi:2-keto-4-pentenoate hydratase